MKKLVLMVALLLAAGCEQRVYEGDLLERQGVYYAPNETDGFTGVNRSFYGNGQLLREVTFKNGKREGLFRNWDENGELEFERCHSNDEIVDMSNCQ